MRVVADGASVTAWCERYRAAGLAVGFVPTMGGLHEGHFSLLRCAKRECDRTVASIFLNPTQFGPGEDMATYPRTPEADMEGCGREGVDLLFMASSEDMYPRGHETWVQVEEMTRVLCGVRRPHHFRGVTTVVTQLLNLVRPHRAYFGQKDHQQAQVIRRMVRDLHIPVRICVCPTVRENDGLALSTRNRRLAPDERRRASCLYAALRAGEELIRSGETRLELVLARMTEVLRPGADLRLDYLEVRDAVTLAGLDAGERLPAGAQVVLAVAAHVGEARLVDNIVVVV